MGILDSIPLTKLLIVKRTVKYPPVIERVSARLLGGKDAPRATVEFFSRGNFTMVRELTMKMGEGNSKGIPVGSITINGSDPQKHIYAQIGQGHLGIGDQWTFRELLISQDCYLICCIELDEVPVNLDETTCTFAITYTGPLEVIPEKTENEDPA
jgi:hypothetical protein